MRAPPSPRGFSLIELMVTIAVVAILASLAVPNMLDYVDKRRLVSQAEAISELLQFARSEAIKHSANTTPKTITATVSPTAPWFVGLSNTGTTACTNDATTPCVLNQGGSDLTRVVTATECTGCTLTSPTAVAVILFDLRGVVTDGTGGGGTPQELTLESAKGTRQLTMCVSPIGRISTCTPSAKPVYGYPICPQNPCS